MLHLCDTFILECYSYQRLKDKFCLCRSIDRYDVGPDSQAIF